MLSYNNIIYIALKSEYQKIESTIIHKKNLYFNEIKYK